MSNDENATKKIRAIPANKMVYVLMDHRDAIMSVSKAGDPSRDGIAYFVTKSAALRFRDERCPQDTVHRWRIEDVIDEAILNDMTLQIRHRGKFYEVDISHLLY